MPTITVRGQKREGSGRIRKSGKKLTYEDTYTYSVVTDDITTTRLQILSAAGIPRVGLTRSGLGLAVCTDVACDRSPINPLEWTVTANFSSEVEEDTSGANENTSGEPTSWTPIAELNFESYQFYRPFDRQGRPFQNSAGLPFSTALPENRTLIKFDFEQFEPESTKIEDIAERNETINSIRYLNKDPKTLKLTVNRASLGYYYGYKVWRVDYSLIWKPETWIYKVLDAGPFYIEGAGAKKNFTTRDPGAQNIIGYLNGFGGASNTPYFLFFDIYEEQNFTQFLRLKA
jgi:hypothetical protein